MDFTRLLTRSALVAFIAMMLRMLGAPGDRAKEIARLTKGQALSGALMFAYVLICDVLEGRGVRAPGEGEDIMHKRLDRLSHYARDFLAAVRRFSKDDAARAPFSHLARACGVHAGATIEPVCLRAQCVLDRAHHNTS